MTLIKICFGKGRFANLGGHFFKISPETLDSTMVGSPTSLNIWHILFFKSVDGPGRWQMFFKIYVLKTFANFMGKTPVFEPLFIQVKDPQDCSFIKRNIQHRCFLVKFAKLLRTPFFYRTTPVAASVIFNLEYLSFMWQGLMGEEF